MQQVLKKKNLTVPNFLHYLMAKLIHLIKQIRSKQKVLRYTVHMQWTIYQRSHGTLITLKPVSVSGHQKVLKYHCWKIIPEWIILERMPRCSCYYGRITWPTPSYSLYSQDVRSCCCSRGYKEILLRCTQCLACCGRAGRTSCSPQQTHNVPAVVLYGFVSCTMNGFCLTATECRKK